MPRLTVLAAFVMPAAFATLAGCASSGAASPGSDFAMAAGQRVALPDASTLRYTGIGNDSRCPPDVQCIRAGDADVFFEHAAATGTARLTLNTERNRSLPLGAWRLQLVDLAPRGNPPVAVLRIEANNETATP